jgi:hypothetical protein
MGIRKTCAAEQELIAHCLGTYGTGLAFLADPWHLFKG